MARVMNEAQRRAVDYSNLLQSYRAYENMYQKYIEKGYGVRERMTFKEYEYRYKETLSLSGKAKGLATKYAKELIVTTSKGARELANIEMTPSEWIENGVEITKDMMTKDGRINKVKLASKIRRLNNYQLNDLLTYMVDTDRISGHNEVKVILY